MDILIRFYVAHDLDLLELKARENFDMRATIKKALRAFVRNEDFIVSIPNEKPKNNFFKNDCLSIRIKNSKDQDIIDFITNIRPGLRNSAIKNILRNYIPAFNIEPYMVPEWSVGKSLMKTMKEDKEDKEKLRKDIITAPPVENDTAKQEQDDSDEFDFISRLIEQGVNK